MKHLRLDSIDIQLYRKAIKNLYIKVSPPVGQVTVSVPKRLSERAVLQFINERLPWIKEQQKKFATYKAPLDAQFIDGETHYLWGKAHTLKVIERYSKHELLKEGAELHLYVRPNTTIKNKSLVVDDFYKKCIEEQLQTLLPTWEERMSVKVPNIVLRRMKSRWGSCRSDGQRICLNSELAKKPLECLEYVLVHEMVHLFEHSHNHRFKTLMDRFLPDWRERKKRLNNYLL